MSLIIPPVPLAYLVDAVDALRAVYEYDMKPETPPLPKELWNKVRHAHDALAWHTGVITKMLAVPVTPPADEKPAPAHDVLIGGGNLR